MSDYFAENAAFIQYHGHALNLDEVVRTGYGGDIISQHLTQTAAAITQTAATQHEAIANAVRLIRECRNNGGTVYTCGNGGSSSTASHITNDLVKAVHVRSVCLTDSVPLLTAYSNDDSYQTALAAIFYRLYRKGDVALCVSVSGNSPNVVMAADEGFYNGQSIIGLGSQRRGRLAELSTVFIEAQSTDMMISESVHTAVAHAIIAGLQE